MRVLLADDHDLVLSGLRLVVGKLGPDTTVFECGDFARAFELAEENQDLDLVVLDLNMPGMPGLTGVEAFCSKFPDLRTVVMSGHYRRQDVMTVLRFGAAGFMPKTLGAAAMLSAFRLVLAGEKYLPAELLSKDEDATATAGPNGGEALGSLTGREREVLRELLNGLTNKEIGRDLNIQEVTVKLHLRSIYRKLEAKNRAHVAKIALEAGFVD